MQTGKVVLFYALGLYSYSAVKILVPAFYALNDTRTPARTSFITVAAKIALNFILIYPLGFLGLALSTTLASWLNFIILIKHLRGRRDSRSFDTGIEVYIRIALASLVMGLLALLVFHGIGQFLSGSGFLTLVLKLGSAIFLSLACLIPLLKIFKVEEGSELLRMVGSLIGKVR